MLSLNKGELDMSQKYKYDTKCIAQKIKEARKRANLTQAELAEKIDISTNAVAKLENNLMAASLQTLISIANVLELDINYLLTPDTGDGDEYLLSLVHNLSLAEKDFIVSVINSLKKYNDKH